MKINFKEKLRRSFCLRKRLLWFSKTERVSEKLYFVSEACGGKRNCSWLLLLFSLCAENTKGEGVISNLRMIFLSHRKASKALQCQGPATLLSLAFPHSWGSTHGTNITGTFWKALSRVHHCKLKAVCKFPFLFVLFMSGRWGIFAQLCVDKVFVILKEKSPSPEI